jgi:hypothetical protein
MIQDHVIAICHVHCPHSIALLKQFITLLKINQTCDVYLSLGKFKCGGEPEATNYFVLLQDLARDYGMT